jgi:hypothetical protein
LEHPTIVASGREAASDSSRRLQPAINRARNPQREVDTELVRIGADDLLVELLSDGREVVAGLRLTQV